jgi:hypothetical protein
MKACKIGESGYEVFRVPEGHTIKVSYPPATGEIKNNSDKTAKAGDWLVLEYDCNYHRIGVYTDREFKKKYAVIDENWED